MAAHVDATGETVDATWARVRVYVDEIVPSFNLIAYYRLGYGVALITDSTYGHDVGRNTRNDGGTTTTVRLSLLRAPRSPDPDATAKPASSDEAVADVPEKPRTKFDFYKLLPEKEVVIPDAELQEQARAEAAQAQALAAEQAERAAAAAAAGEEPPSDSLSLDSDAPGARPAIGWRWRRSSRARAAAHRSAPRATSDSRSSRWIVQYAGWCQTLPHGEPLSIRMRCGRP